MKSITSRKPVNAETGYLNVVCLLFAEGASWFDPSQAAAAAAAAAANHHHLDPYHLDFR